MKARRTERRAVAHGVKFPLSAFPNEREAINDWIRTSGKFDGVVDTRDPADPKHIKAEYDHGDHLHPNDAGYEAMAASIDLGMLGVK